MLLKWEKEMTAMKQETGMLEERWMFLLSFLYITNSLPNEKVIKEDEAKKCRGKKFRATSGC